VFEDIYQPRQVCEDLTRLAFGPRAGCNDNLFQMLLNMSLSREAGAPIHLTTRDTQGFQERQDIPTLRAALATADEAGDKKEKRATKLTPDNLIATLSQLQLLEKRKNYFNRVDTIRA
ncbi:hypothetical protein K469DRAFT_593670, partial [Zopfia rhizophila CBS 207.26]